MRQVASARPGLGGKGRAGTAATAASGQRDSTSYVYAAGRMVGAVRGGIFSKRVRRSLHLLRIPEEAWAFSVETLDAAEAAGAMEVEVHEEEAGTTYRLPLRTVRQGQPLNRGFGLQLSVPLRFWSVSDSRQLRLFEEVA